MEIIFGKDLLGVEEAMLIYDSCLAERFWWGSLMKLQERWLLGPQSLKPCLGLAFFFFIFFYMSFSEVSVDISLNTDSFHSYVQSSDEIATKDILFPVHLVITTMSFWVFLRSFISWLTVPIWSCMLSAFSSPWNINHRYLKFLVW